MSHMVATELNMSNLRDAKTRVAVGDSGTPSRTKFGGWHSYHKNDVELQCVMLSVTDVIPVLRANVFRATQSLQNYFQVTSEDEYLMLKIN